MHFYILVIWGRPILTLDYFISGLHLDIHYSLFGTMLMHDENRYDMLKQLWIVPVSKMGYFFSKFFVVLIYSVCFMLITAFASVLFSVIPNYVAFDFSSILLLFERCLEIAILTAFAILPILAISASQKGYIFPISVIVARNEAILGLALPQNSISLALLSICVWGIASVLLAKIKLSKRK